LIEICYNKSVMKNHERKPNQKGTKAMATEQTTSKKPVKFSDIPKIFPTVMYSADVNFEIVKGGNYIEEWMKIHDVNLDPDYQRDYVWTEKQEIAFVEFCLRGGEAGRQIYINAPGWRSGRKRTRPEIVDGKQRIKAVIRFLNNEIPAFGHFRREYVDSLSFMGLSTCFRINVVELSRKNVLKFYIDLNAGGTIHSEEEITRVKNLLESE